MKKNRISKNWIKRQHKDPFVKASKVKGYRSRSAFKLIEIDQKFKILTKNISIVDLGSNPGGWSQIAAERSKKSKILSIDLKPMENINGVNFLMGDFLQPNIQLKISNFFAKKIDLIMSDMAANTTGNKNLDSFKTSELCLHALDFAKKNLKENGVFIAKCFMGSDFKEIEKKANKFFKTVVNYNPSSSRKESRELYIYCKKIFI